MNLIFEYGVAVFSVLCYIVLLNGICGWVGFGIWSCLKRIWERKGQYKVLYGCLKIVILLFVIPLGWLMISSRNWLIGTNVTYNGYPWVNTQIAAVLTGIFALWLLGAAKNFREYVLEKRYLRRLEGMGYILAEQEGGRDQSFPKVYLCPGIYSPMISGIFRKKLYLPQREYTPYAKEIIMEHELTHLRNHDLLFKNLCAVITVLYWFCPWVKCIFREYDCWSEEICDMELCIGKNARWSAKEYYSVIFSEIEHGSARKLKSCSALFENQNTIEWRIKAMKHFYSVPKRNRWSSIILACVFVLSCPVTAFAAGNVLEEGLENTYENTMTYVEEEPQIKISDSADEKTGQIEKDENVIQVEADVTRGYAGYSPVLEKGEKFVATNLSLKKGDQITLWVEMKSGAGPVDIGLIKDGSTRYVSLKESGSHTFKIDKDGIYDVYVKNQGDVTAELEFGYHY